MPIYDYRCRACHKRFAVFFRSFSAVASDVRCEHCGSDRIARMAPRVARMTSEDERLDRLGDARGLGDMDENDPASVARWAKRLGGEMGEDMDDGLDEAMDEMGGGGLAIDGEAGPKP